MPRQTHGGEYIDLNPKLVRKSLVAIKRDAEDDDISARVQALLKRNKGRTRRTRS